MIHGYECKFYDGDVVKVGTTADRFTIKVPAEESSWVATRLRAELIARELATAEELPMGEVGEAAMAAKATAKARGAASKAATKMVKEAAAADARAAAALAAAEQDVKRAEHKRELAFITAQHEAKVRPLKAKAARLVTSMAQVASVETKVAPLQATLETWFSQMPA